MKLYKKLLLKLIESDIVFLQHGFLLLFFFNHRLLFFIFLLLPFLVSPPAEEPTSPQYEEDEKPDQQEDKHCQHDIPPGVDIQQLCSECVVVNRRRDSNAGVTLHFHIALRGLQLRCGPDGENVHRFELLQKRGIPNMGYESDGHGRAGLDVFELADDLGAEVGRAVKLDFTPS